MTTAPPRVAARPTSDSAAYRQPSQSDIGLSSKGPVLRIDASGPSAITIGKQAEYEITVVNMGDAQAKNIVVGVLLPEWVQVVGSEATLGSARRHSEPESAGQIVWTVDSVAPRGQQMLKLRVVPGANEPFELSVDWTFQPALSSARIEVQVPQLEMALSGPRDVMYGETKTYGITLTNPGTGAAENVKVQLSETLGGTTIDVGTLAAGAQKRLDIELTATQSGEVALHAVATADTELQAEVSETVLVRRAALEVAIRGAEFKYAGSIGSYQIRVANTGDAVADDVVAAVAIPDGVKYLAGLDRGDQVAGGIRWTIGKLAPGAERVYDIQCELAGAGEKRIEVGTRAAGDLAASQATVTKVEALADLKLTVNDPQGPKPVGQDVTYELVVVNRGTKAAEDVQILAMFSEGIEPVSTTGHSAQIAPGQAVFAPISRIGAGESLTLKVTARADRAGNHVFRMELKCDAPETRRVSEGMTRFFGDSTPRTTGSPQNTEPRVGRQPAPAQPLDLR